MKSLKLKRALFIALTIIAFLFLILACVMPPVLYCINPWYINFSAIPIAAVAFFAWWLNAMASKVAELSNKIILEKMFKNDKDKEINL